MFPNDNSASKIIVVNDPAASEAGNPTMDHRVQIRTVFTGPMLKL